MDWQSERYVKVYTRDTVDWLSLSFEAQAVWLMLLRKLDKAGRLDLGKRGKRGIAAIIGHTGRWDAIEPAIDELIADGCLVIEGDKVLAPNFSDAQEARQTEAARKAAQRERDRAKADADGCGQLSDSAKDSVATLSRAVTPVVTRGHTESYAVTQSHSIPAIPAIPAKTNTLSADADPLAEAEAGKSYGLNPITAVAGGSEGVENPPPPALTNPTSAATPKPTKHKSPRTGQVIALWCDLWREAKGNSYDVTKVAAGCAKTLAGFPSATDEEIAKRFGAALVDTWLHDKLDLPLFVSNWNKLGAATGPPPRDWRKGRVGAEEIKHSNVTGIVKWGGQKHGPGEQVAAAQAPKLVPSEVGKPPGNGAGGGTMGGAQGSLGTGAGGEARAASGGVWSGSAFG